MTPLEQMRERLKNGSLTYPPGYLLDLMIAWEEPRQKGEPEGLTNARELLSKSPKAFSDQMSKHLSEWLAVEKAAQEARAAEAKLEAAKLGQGMASPSEEGPDEGTERLFEIADQVLKGVGV